MAAARVFSSSVSSEFFAAWDCSLPAALPPPGPDPVGDGSVLWILRCASLEQFPAGGEAVFRTGIPHQITRVGSCQAPSRGLCISKLEYRILFAAQQKFPMPEGLFSFSVMMSIPCSVPFPQINFWAGSWASPFVPSPSFRFLLERPSMIRNLILLTGHFSIRISGKCLRRKDAWQLFDKILQREWISRSGSQDSSCAKHPPEVVLPQLSLAEITESIHGVAADEKSTSYEASTVGTTGASPPLLPLRQMQERKTLHSSSNLLSQIYRGKHNPGHSASFQILIKIISGKTLLQWVRALDPVQNLKQELEFKLGIPSAAQRLLHEGKQLEDFYPLSFYSIMRNSSLALTLRLRGGATGQSSSAEAFSYKDAVHAKLPKRTAHPAHASKPFLVDKLEETPSIEIMHPGLDEQTQHFIEFGIICRFNGLWPRIADLYQWLHSNWTNNCKVLLCSKGFFIVVFAFVEDYQKALTSGPWFWGVAGLFLMPWFPDFDPSTAVITKLPIWVRLPNLPANLWHFAVFQGIGSSLGRLLDTDISRGEKGLHTFARICAEIDISKGLPDQISLKIGDFHWTQTLDYENTAFRCRNCHHTGHLQSSCPSMPAQKKKANTKQKSKSWMPHDPPPMDDFDFSSDEEEEIKEGVADASEPDPSPVGPVDSAITPASQKRIHESSTSDSDKETSPSALPSLQIILAQQSPPEWVKVGKKKGKKCKTVDSAHVG